MRILILDDDPNAFTLTDNLLKECLPTVTTFYANQEVTFFKFLADLREKGDLLPDLILVELHMPGFDAWELLKELKGKADTKEIPIAFFSRYKNAKSQFLASRLNIPLFYKGRRFIDQANAITKMKKWFDNLIPGDTTFRSVY